MSSDTEPKGTLRITSLSNVHFRLKSGFLRVKAKELEITNASSLETLPGAKIVFVLDMPRRES